jgi:hypothetical protein
MGDRKHPTALFPGHYPKNDVPAAPDIFIDHGSLQNAQQFLERSIEEQRKKGKSRKK